MSDLDDLARSPHVADSRPIGTLSPMFMKRVRSEAAARIRAAAIAPFRVSAERHCAALAASLFRHA